MAIEYLGNGNPSGTVVCKNSTDLLGFYGIATPVARPSITAVGTATATTTLNETKIDRLYTALLSIGIIATDG